MQKRVSMVLLLVACLVLLAACSKPATQESQTAPAAQSQAQPEPGKPTAAQQKGLSARPAPTGEKAAAAQPVTLPEGTELTVRLAQAVGSKISQTGQSFTAHVAEPVEKDGKVVVPEGSEVTGHVAEAAPLGRFKGGAKLSLALDELVVAGKHYPVSGSVSRAAKGKGKRTATMIGGGAGVGALIGGLAGGGKGAAIGALAGAGAGTAGSAFTGNKDIELPAETALTFKLRQPVDLR